MNRIKIFALLLLVAMNAQADPWFRHDHPRDFRRHDERVWVGGSWYHGDYRGRVGWYWIVGDSYYYYPRPIYPYPNPYIPPTVVVAPPVRLEGPPQSSVWYFCESADAYYPYVSECVGEWRVVPAVPPGHRK